MQEAAPRGKSVFFNPFAKAVPPEERFFKAGDRMQGRVVWANARGAKVALLQDERIIG